MKIAVACEGNTVTGHFGHCEGFNIFTVENNEITKKEFVANPGHRKGFLPNFLNELGVNVIIAGGMGQGATDIFKENNIETITGATGAVDKAIESYLNGELVSTGSVCNQHQHRGECGEE